MHKFKRWQREQQPVHATDAISIDFDADRMDKLGWRWVMRWLADVQPKANESDVLI